MVNLALFHATLPQYLRSQAGEADQKNLQVVLSGERKEQLLAAAGTVRVDALVVDLALLGEQPEAVLDELERAFNPELSLVVYAFAKWDLIERLRGPRRQLLRAPVSARSLRSNMIGLIVKHLASSTSATATAVSPEATLLRLEQQPPMRRYDDMQLAALQDVKSLVDCECPNQVADLVLALNAFETYSAQCQNRNEKDAQIHRMLARVTGHARAVMEYALKELCAFENIDPAALVRQAGRANG
ncbi:hypothetical protein [Aquimonas voraii]|uniref:Uncharacterized protein n=1 Tax=Aquimonas voraii TaxID=265719 RepID=A0A1G6U7M7_9GAMM|nr:hypothetical protein [Aquimonas voraii]SDD36716.1 hypothetical protein SAMN04488509_102180 [Aquimonas voraii]